MRQSIETAPRDGNCIILEDDANGTYEVAHWSSEAGGWVGENDEPSKITPSHWYPMWGLFAVAAPEISAAVGAPAAQTQANRRFAILIVATVAIGALLGVYFLTGYSGLQANFRELTSQELRKPGSFALRPQAEVEQARAKVATQDAAQTTQAVETLASEARQSLKNEQQSEASANELAAPRQEVSAARKAMTTSAEQQRRALNEAQARATALASELAETRRDTDAAMQVSHRRNPPPWVRVPRMEPHIAPLG